MTPELNTPINRPEDPNEYVTRILEHANNRTVSLHETMGRIREVVYMVYIHGMEDGAKSVEARQRMEAYNQFKNETN